MAPRSHPILPATAAILICLLAGCAPTTPTGPTDPATESPVTPSAEPPSPSAEPVEAIDVACDALVSADTMYDFNPNFGAVDAWEPDAGTPAADAVDHEGVACRWLNQTSADTIDLSVANRNEADLEALKNSAIEQSTMVPTYGGDEGYFSVADGIGTAIVFDHAYWLVVSSGYFFEPGDAAEIVGSALDALP
jgi:hypothetical protein